MSGLPQGWVEAPLADLVSVARGITFAKHQRRDTPEIDCLPCLRTSNVQAELTTERMAYVPASCVKRDDQIVATGDLIISMSNSSDLVGKVALASDAHAGFAFGAFLAALRSPAFDPRALWYLVKSSRVQEELRQTASQTTNIANISATGMAKIKLPLPPLAEQQRIVGRLDALTARTARARAELGRIPALAARYKQAVLAKAFGGELVPFDRVENITIGEIAAKLFDGPFGSNLKSDDYVDEGVRVVRLENISALSFVETKRTFISHQKFADLQRHELKPDDVMFSSFVAEQVRVCVLPALDTPAINKADCFCIRLDRARCDPRFLAYQLSCETSFQHFEGLVHGATRPRINLGQLRTFGFNLPSLDCQARVVNRIDTAFAEIDRLTAEAAAARRLLHRLDQAVLAKAFRGELVPQDPADEAASVLLDRIRAERAATPTAKRGRKPAAA